MKKIYYLAFKQNNEKDRDRFAVAAADLQVSYLSQILSEIGYEVEIVSPNLPRCDDKIIGFQRGFRKRISDHISVKYFTCFYSSNKYLQALSLRLIFLVVRKYLKSMTDGIVLIYHSRLFFPYYRTLKNLGIKYVLEVEEIYSDVIGNSKLRKREIEEVLKGDAFIVPSVPLAEEISQGKEYVLYHGTCKREERIGQGFQDNKIHIVYAGTFDPRVIGDMSFIKIAHYLNSRYMIHILGFGLCQADVDRVKEAIDNTRNCECKVTYEGMLYGDDYLRFIQNCHIGIFTRETDGEDLRTSFPSKIMSYLSNGLHVVSIKTDSIVKSNIAHLLTFCESNDAADIAKAIESIDFSEPFDSRKALEEVEISLKEQLAYLLSK